MTRGGRIWHVRETLADADVVERGHVAIGAVEHMVERRAVVTAARRRDDRRAGDAGRVRADLEWPFEKAASSGRIGRCGPGSDLSGRLRGGERDGGVRGVRGA